MINFKTKLNFIVLLLLRGLLSLEPEMKTVHKRVGETICLHSDFAGEQASPQILWFFSANNLKIKIAQLFEEKIIMDYERFRNRLSLDRQTWCLNISDLNSSDTGVYHVTTITGGGVSDLKLNLIVYSPVSKPVITHIIQSHSVRSLDASTVRRQNCLALCSVENEREVTLSWQRERETLWNTSSPDLNTDLTLTLEVQERNASYTCEAKNPVSIQSVHLNTEEICPQNTDSSSTRNRILAGLLTSSLAVTLIGIVASFVKHRKHKKDHLSRKEGTDDLLYADVRTGTHPETKHLEDATGGLNSVTEDQIVYADVRK